MMPVTLYYGKQSCGKCKLVEQELFDQFGVRGVKQSLRVMWTAGVSWIERDLQCSAKGAAHRFLIKSAHTVDSLKLPRHTIAVSEVVKQYAHLQGLPIADIQRAALYMKPTGSDNVNNGIIGYHSCSLVSNQELHDLLKSYYTLEGGSRVLYQSSHHDIRSPRQRLRA